MRRQRNIFDTFPETVDLNQGPNFNGLDLNESDDCNIRLSPTERRLLSTDISSDLNKSQGFSSWDVGESSSSSTRTNAQDHVANNWSSQFGTHDSRFIRERQFDHQIPVVPMNMQNAHIPMDVDLNLEYGVNSSNDGGHGNADMEASSSRVSNERGANNSMGLFSPIANSREPVIPDLSHHRSNQQPPIMQVPGLPINLLPFPWVGAGGGSRIGSSSSSGFPRENRNLVHDSPNWSLGNGASNGGNHSQSSSRNESIWMPNLNSTTREPQRSSDFPPWTLFPSSEIGSGGHHRGHFRHFPPGPSTTPEENGGNSPFRNHQPFLRPLEVPEDEWHAFGADIDGRHRLVSEMRQILHALRRGENLRAEDYVLFDPFINGAADLQDRHRDMRLDVDNMSYEELLALEERIGDVKTGLTEEEILKLMKQRKHFSFVVLSPQNLEPCCICREEYENGDDIGSLDCGHDFHTCCIKEWLTQKNLCPICKMTALST